MSKELITLKKQDLQCKILKSENKKALNAIKTLAKVLDIESSMNENEKENDFIIEKGVKISKPKENLMHGKWPDP